MGCSPSPCDIPLNHADSYIDYFISFPQWQWYIGVPTDHFWGERERERGGGVGGVRGDENSTNSIEGMDLENIEKRRIWVGCPFPFNYYVLAI